MSRPQILEPVEAYALWAPDYPPHAHNPVMQAEERAMLALMPTDLRAQSVLDVGCGSGRYMLHALRRGAAIELVQGSVAMLPVPNAWADLTICGLALGHLDRLQRALAELRRVTRPGGTLLCSDVHPIGHALGWQRDFKAGGRRYAVRHTPHLYSHWHAICAA